MTGIDDPDAALEALAAMLEGNGDLPPASRQWLRDCLRRWANGLAIDAALQLDTASAIRQRDDLIRRHANEIEGHTPTARAAHLAAEARRLHSGRQTRYPWLTRADRLRRLAEWLKRWGPLA